eukprot:TRINITY_DN31891_c0_g1_i1.p1 TRINITY_DN31891_c0_g1~~TRINITY_DN31891_c0_g1_i1.p1  ORF type:complete len:245 (+),score=59.89 TRINITY_DN31891_c0_g1_i1:75-809(+)
MALDILAVDDNGYNRFHDAVLRVDLCETVMQVCLDAEAGNEQALHLINAKTADGQTALHIAALVDNIEAAKVLLKPASGFNEADAAEAHGGTALLHAACGGHSEIAKAILASPKFTKVNLQAEDGTTALHQAARVGCADIVHAILKHQHFTRINQAEIIQGETALHLAASSGHSDIVQMLLTARADMNIETRGFIFRSTALDLARKGGHDDIAQVLAEAGALEASQGLRLPCCEVVCRADSTRC